MDIQNVTLNDIMSIVKPFNDVTRATYRVEIEAVLDDDSYTDGWAPSDDIQAAMLEAEARIEANVQALIRENTQREDKATRLAEERDNG
tara:strand:- start:447 stop:713 length:267 start_codon:yes stop_codon:yes gene_type:complete